MAWIGTRLQIVTAAYNTKLIKTTDLPKSYQDLLDPKWKGKLGLEATDLDWFATVISTMGEAKGLQLFHDIIATNGVSVRKGHSRIANTGYKEQKLSVSRGILMTISVASYATNFAVHHVP